MKCFDEKKTLIEKAIKQCQYIDCYDNQIFKLRHIEHKLIQFWIICVAEKKIETFIETQMKL
jgi:hypothetical protein